MSLPWLGNVLSWFLDPELCLINLQLFTRDIYIQLSRYIRFTTNQINHGFEMMMMMMIMIGKPHTNQPHNPNSPIPFNSKEPSNPPRTRFAISNISSLYTYGSINFVLKACICTCASSNSLKKRFFGNQLMIAHVTHTYN